MRKRTHRPDTYGIDISGSIRKSVVVWGHEQATAYPIMYIRKPKWMSQESFDNMIDKVRISLPARMEFKGDSE